MAVLPDVFVDWTLSPRLIQILSTLDEIKVSDLHDTLRMLEALPQNSDDVSLLNTDGHSDLGDGLFTGLTTTLDNAQVAFEPRLVSKENGTVTTGDATGQTLTDSTALFVTNGVEPGATVVNLTDGSATTVVKVIDEDELVCWRLKDGSDNQFDIGDSYKIWNVVQCEVKLGNVVSKDSGGSPISPVFPTAFTQVILARATDAAIIETGAGGGSWEDDEKSQIRSALGVDGDKTPVAAGGQLQDLQTSVDASRHLGKVWIDADNGSAGGAGTPDDPVQTLAQGRVIGVAKKLRTYVLNGSFALSDDDWTHHRFEAWYSILDCSINVNNRDVNGSVFHYCTVTGTQQSGADTTYIECSLENLVNAAGVAFRCVFGNVTLSSALYALDCAAPRLTGGATINAAGGYFDGWRLAGLWTFTGCVGTGIWADFQGNAEARYDNTNTGGLGTVYGDVIVVDNSGPGFALTDRSTEDRHGVGSWEGSTPAAIAAEVDTELSGTHGSGSWEGTTPAAIDTELSATHGSGNWETGAGITDWSSGEREQIRDALGVDGDKMAAAGGQLQTVGTAVTLIKKIETGRWKIDEGTSTMIFYDDDGLTPLLTFDLLDLQENSSIRSVFERKPV